MVISPQSQKYLWLYFFSLYIDQLEEERRKISATFSSLPDSSLPLFLHLLQGFVLLKFAAPFHFFCFQGLFLKFLHLFFMFALDDCWWELFKSLEMFYCHEFMFICYGISRVWSCLLVYVKELRSPKNRTHTVCMMSEFSGFNTDVFAFFWYFS